MSQKFAYLRHTSLCSLNVAYIMRSFRPLQLVARRPAAFGQPLSLVGGASLPTSAGTFFKKTAVFHAQRAYFSNNQVKNGSINTSHITADDAHSPSSSSSFSNSNINISHNSSAPSHVTTPPSSSVHSHAATTSPTETDLTKGLTPAASAGVSVLIKAYYIARSIDVRAIPNFSSYKSSRRVQQAKSVTITLSEELNQYISIFQYGSVVFFNIPEAMHQEHLQRLVSPGILQEPIIPFDAQLTENYKVIVHQSLEKPSVIKAEHLNIQKLDIKNVEIVGTIMAESVALDYYSTTVDALLSEYIHMNHRIHQTGEIFGYSTKSLHQLIASNNIIITNVLSKMGLFEGTDAAWDNADYHYTWEGTCIDV